MFDENELNLKSLKYLYILPNRSANASGTLGNETGTGRESGTTGNGSGDSEREKERGSARRRGCGGKKSGRGTG